MSAREDGRRARLRRRAFAELEADPRFARFRRRSGRRRLLAVHVAWGVAGYATLGLLLEAVASGVPLAVFALVWLAGFVVLTGWLNASVGGVTELPYDLLDEAQIAVRRRAEADGHRVVRVMLFLVGLWAVGSLGARRGALDSGRAVDTVPTVLLSVPEGWWTWAMIAIAAVCSLLAILPLYLLAWRLPDDIAEPEDVAETA
jgi:hypothetical protein